MAAFLVAAGIVGVMLPVMVQESSFPTDWAGWISFRSGINTFGGVRRPLMSTLFALILLMTMSIFSVAIKVCFVVALRAPYLI